jgi:hypothetical protein
MGECRRVKPEHDKIVFSDEVFPQSSLPCLTRQSRDRRGEGAEVTNVPETRMLLISNELNTLRRTQRIKPDSSGLVPAIQCRPAPQAA